jgi:hypothetical protein
VPPCLALDEALSKSCNTLRRAGRRLAAGAGQLGRRPMPTPSRFDALPARETTAMPDRGRCPGSVPRLANGPRPTAGSGTLRAHGAARRASARKVPVRGAREPVRAGSTRPPTSRRTGCRRSRGDRRRADTPAGPVDPKVRVAHLLRRQRDAAPDTRARGAAWADLEARDEQRRAEHAGPGLRISATCQPRPVPRRACRTRPAASWGETPGADFNRAIDARCGRACSPQSVLSTASWDVGTRRTTATARRGRSVTYALREVRWSLSGRAIPRSCRALEYLR